MPFLTYFSGPPIPPYLIHVFFALKWLQHVARKIDLGCFFGSAVRERERPVSIEGTRGHSVASRRSGLSATIHINALNHPRSGIFGVWGGWGGQGG